MFLAYAAKIKKTSSLSPPSQYSSIRIRVNSDNTRPTNDQGVDNVIDEKYKSNKTQANKVYTVATYTRRLKRLYDNGCVYSPTSFNNGVGGNLHAY